MSGNDNRGVRTGGVATPELELGGGSQEGHMVLPGGRGEGIRQEDVGKSWGDQKIGRED